MPTMLLAVQVSIEECLVIASIIDAHYSDAIQFSKHLQVCGTKCDICNTLFIDGRVDFTEEERLNALNAHMCESDPRGTLQCDECPLKMRSMRSYVIHKNRHHGTEYAFEERVSSVKGNDNKNALLDRTSAVSRTSINGVMN